MKPEGELLGAGWRIVFFRAADRIAHRVEVAAADGWQPLLESAEGSPQEAWPASPALQQIHFQNTPDGRHSALLVGMAGRSHFSASVAVPADGNSAAFEIACRAKAAPEQLGTAYLLPGNEQVKQATHAGGNTALLIGRLQLSSQPTTAWTGDRDRLRLIVKPAQDDWPQTISWRYEISFRV